MKAQQDNQWLGLSAEIKDLCLEVGIPDINENYISYRDIKKTVLERVICSTSAELSMKNRVDVEYLIFKLSQKTIIFNCH